MGVATHLSHLGVYMSVRAIGTVQDIQEAGGIRVLEVDPRFRQGWRSSLEVAVSRVFVSKLYEASVNRFLPVCD